MVLQNSIEYINPIKRNQVFSCLEVAKKHSKISKLIIFGSAITNDCSENSDIDICLDIIGSTRCREMYELIRDLRKACDHNCDILIYNNIQNPIKNEVDKKGLIIYEKEARSI